MGVRTGRGMGYSICDRQSSDFKIGEHLVQSFLFKDEEMNPK